MVDATQRDVTHDLSAYERDGYVVLEHAIDVATIERIRTELSPWLGDGRVHRAATTSRASCRTASTPCSPRRLRSPTLVEHPWVLAMLDQLLLPNYLLSANLAINLLPGETAQQFHFDDDFYPVPSAPPGDQRQRDLGDRRVHRRERGDRGHPRAAIAGATRSRRTDHADVARS